MATTPRLPIPGQDDGTWGDILNTFLSQSHQADGTLATDSVGAPQVQAGSLPVTKLDNSAQTAITSIAGKYTKPSGGIPASDLDNASQTALTRSASSVQSINTKTPDGSGAVILTASDVSALPAGTKLSQLADTSAAATASNNQVLSYSSGSNSWVPATVSSTTVSDATSGTKGIVQLTGDLGGTAASPTVPGLASKAPLANPTFTGTVTVPSPVSGTDATTKTYVDSAAASAATPDATTGSKGKIQLAGDLGGTAASPTVPGLSAKAPLNNPTFTGTVTVPTPVNTTDATTKSYVDSAASSGTPDATTGSKGKIQLAGDLGGTAASPTVPGLATKAPLNSPTFTGTVTVPAPVNGTDASTKTYVDTAAASLATADATPSVKGKLQLAGDLAGTAASPSVVAVRGVAISGTPSIGQVLIASGSTAAAWAPAPSAPVSSVNSKTGAVTLTASDVSAAPLNSPTFTGTVTVPTPVNTTDATTKAYVDSAASAGTPDATVSTKGKLQLAGDLAGTAASPTVPGLAAKAPLASPTFTGTVTVPAPVNSTDASTKAYVDSAAPDATSSVKGKVQLAGDLGGTAASPTVPGLAAKAPLNNPTFTGTVTVPAPVNGTDATTKTYVDSAASAGTPDASGSTKGKIQLAGDLSGTAASPTVPGLAAKAPLASPTFTGTVTVPTPVNTTDATTKAYVDSAASAGTPDATTGSKGKIQLAGDLGGTAASPTVPGLAAKAPLNSPTFTGAPTISGDAIATASQLSGYVAALKAAKDGSTDAAAVIQSAIDGGLVHIDLDPGGTYLLDSALFLDNTDKNAKIVIDMHGATIKLGANLPTCPDFTPDPTVQWGIFNNVKRTALSGGVVDAGNNRASSSGASLSRLIVKNGIIDGQGANRGLMFANTGTMVGENLTLYQGFALQSWTGYSDGPVLRHCHYRSPVSGGALLYQIDNGDGVILDLCKSDSSGYIANLSDCNGAHISAGVSGSLKFSDCHGIKFTGGHYQLNLPNVPASMITVNNSTIEFSGLWISSMNGGTYAVNINDTPGVKHSDITVRHSVGRQTVQASDGDIARMPDLYITAANPSTKVRWLHNSMEAAVAGTASTYYMRVGPSIASADSGIQSAIDAAGALIASSNWELKKRGTAWEVVSALPGVNISRKVSQPTSLTLNSTADGLTGALTNGQTYEYAAALCDAEGRYGPVSTAVSAAATVSGCLRLSMTVPTTPSMLVVWRKTGTGVLAAPDCYVALPWDGTDVRLYDTGTTINRNPWLTSSVPVPNTVAATDHSQNRLVLDTGTIYPPLFARATSDTTRNNSASALATPLSVTPDADGVYIVEGWVTYEATTTADIKFNWATPTGSTLYWTVEGPQIATSSALSTQVYLAQKRESDVIPLGGEGTGTLVTAKINGLLVMGTTAGSLTLQFAQNVAEATDAIVHTGSWLVARRMS